ncbi:transposase [Kitasatospora sp. NPDC056651]|uniref:transposase n=1 Tax=Kitasatospora sp. NPDC056651 TaxID=3345892 RepID=UPI003689B31A
MEPLLPAGKRPGRPPTRTRRQLIDGTRWRTRAGTTGRGSPERYGPRDRFYDLFRRWRGHVEETLGGEPARRCYAAGAALRGGRRRPAEL